MKKIALTFILMSLSVCLHSNESSEIGQNSLPEWEISYPNNAINYINSFRHELFSYDVMNDELNKFFKVHGIENVCELGCGTGTHLILLSQLGYNCVGTDASDESIEIARNVSRQQLQNIDYHVMDFYKEMPDKKFDAILLLCIPMSIKDTEELAVRVAKNLKPGGFFITLMLGKDPNKQLDHLDVYNSVEYTRYNDEPVIRFNFYSKNDQFVDWHAVYLTGNSEGSKMYTDHDKFDLLEFGTVLDLPSNIYKHVERLDLSRCKETQAPPMTIEVFDVYQLQ